MFQVDNNGVTFRIKEEIHEKHCKQTNMTNNIVFKICNTQIVAEKISFL